MAVQYGYNMPMVQTPYGYQPTPMQSYAPAPVVQMAPRPGFHGTLCQHGHGAEHERTLADSAASSHVER